MTDTFTCFRCGGVFAKGWTDEEAEAEYIKTYGQPMGEQIEVMCDKCHGEFMEWLKKHKRNLQ